MNKSDWLGIAVLASNFILLLITYFDVRGIRKEISDIKEILSNIRERLAVVETSLGIKGPTLVKEVK